MVQPVFSFLGAARRSDWGCEVVVLWTVGQIADGKVTEGRRDEIDELDGKAKDVWMRLVGCSGTSPEDGVGWIWLVDGANFSSVRRSLQRGGLKVVARDQG